MAVVSMGYLLEARCSFWSSNKKMESKNERIYLHMQENGIYIIDLQKTV